MLCIQGQIVFHEKLIEQSVHHWANFSHYLHSEKNSTEGQLTDVEGIWLFSQMASVDSFVPCGSYVVC